MNNLASIFIFITAVLHCLFFKLESIDFMKTSVLKKFGLTKEEGIIVKIWAFNQGFYNLFLALGLFFSLFLLNTNQSEKGILLSSFILLTIISAGVVLLYSSPKSYPAALLQSLPALTALIAVLCL